MIDQLIEFSGNHVLLVAAFVVTLLVLLYNLASGNEGDVSAQQATIMLNHEDAVIVDVRPPADFAKGHIIHAINIPVTSLQKQLKQLEKYKDKPVIVSCRSGAQSAAARRQLIKQGFQNVHNLKGGILAWQSENLPVTTK